MQYFQNIPYSSSCPCFPPARGVEATELQVPGRAQSVEGAKQLRKSAHRTALQGNVSTAGN